MAIQIDKILYEVLAKNFDASRAEIVNSDGFLNDALVEVVDITTTGYSEGIQAAIDVELTVALT